MLRELFEVLEEIESTPSRNEKLEILKKAPEEITWLLKLGMNPYYTYGIRDVNLDANPSSYFLPQKDSLIEFFMSLNDRRLTGNAAKEKAQVFLGVKDDMVRKWLGRILNKDFRMGMSGATVNKVFPDTIPQFELGLCSEYDPEEQGDIFAGGDWVVEPKLDGLRCIAIIDKTGTSAQLLSRAGNVLYNTEIVEKELLSLGVADVVFDGEIIAKDWNLTQSIAHSKEEHPDRGVLTLQLFDCLPISQWQTDVPSEPYEKRYDYLKSILKDDCPHLAQVLGLPVSTLDGATLLFDGYLLAGYEGVVLKKKDSVYSFGRSKDWRKWKPVITVDIPITGFMEGTGKNVGRLGAVYCDLAGKKVKVGSGFSDTERTDIWENKEAYLGRILEVKAQEVTKDGSLRFPRFLRFRTDKD